MLGSIPQSKICFVTFLLEDEQELSLGMLDTSPMYLYFLIVPCYYIICFGCLMGFIMHFYIIFGTNLLTGGPVQIAVFFAYFSVSQKRNIKRSPNGMKPSGRIVFGTNTIQETWSGHQGSNKAATR